MWDLSSPDLCLLQWKHGVLTTELPEKSLFKKKKKDLFLAVLGLSCCTGCILVAVLRILIAGAPPIEERGLQGLWASVIAARRLSSCGTPA